MAFRQHFQFGEDVVFTYGPLGFLALGGRFDFFGTWLIAMAAHLLVHLAFFAVLAFFLTRVGARLWHWLLLGSVFLLPLAFPYFEYECMAMAVVLLQMALTDNGRRTALAAAVSAGFVLGLLLVVKGTGAAATLGLLVVFSVLALVRRRLAMAGVTALAIGIAFVGLWVFAGQHLDAIFPYFRAAAEIVSGYATGMGYFELVALNYLPTQLWIAAAGMGVLGIVLVAALMRDDWPLVSIVALGLPVEFVTFKEAFVRLGDRHMVYLTMLLVLDVLVLVQASLGPRLIYPRLRVVIPGVSAGLIALSSLAFLTSVGVMVPPPIKLPTSTFGARIAGYGSAFQLITSSAARSTMLSSRRADAQAAFSLPSGIQARLRTSSVDAFPEDLALVNAYQLRWRPAGVLQSYQAYTPYLDSLDAANYAKRGPEFVVLNDQSIDDRYMPFDEPAFFRSLLQRYTADSRFGSMVLLSRTAPVSATRIDLGRNTHRLGDWIPVPIVNGKWTMSAVDTQLSLLGHLYNLVFQGPEAHITLRLDDGSEHRFRLLPTSQDGLLVSDFVGGTDDYTRLFTGRLTAHHVAAFRVTTLDPAAFIDEFSTHFYAVPSR